jgi:hypothetical protein
MTTPNITINDSTNTLVAGLLNLSVSGLLGNINSTLLAGPSGEVQVTYLNTTTGTMTGVEISYDDFGKIGVSGTGNYPALTVADLWAQTAASNSNSVLFTYTVS